MSHTPGKVLRALHEGKITEREADAYLRATRGITLDTAEHRHNLRAYLVTAFMFLAIIVGLFIPQGTLTGFVTYNGTPEGNLSTIDIPVVSPINRLSASGTMHGEGAATLVFEANGTNYTVATLASDTGLPRTAQASYAPGEDVTLEHADGASVYLDDGTETTPVIVPFPAPGLGVYELLVITNDSGTLATVRTPLVVSAVPAERATPFSGECGQACTLPGVGGVLHVVTDGTTVALDLDVAYATPNRAPVALPINDVTAPVTIDLSEHFVDPDEDEILYSTSPGEHVIPTLDGSMLALTPVSDGEETFIVYASDLQELVQLSFTVTSVVNETTNASVNETTNATINITTNGTNDVPVNITINATTNGTGNLSGLDCSSPDPNLRPLACLQEAATEYFPEEAILWTDLDRKPVAELNQIGNLLVTGDVIEYSTAEPGSRDFRIGLPDRDGNVRTAAWVDTQGDLHLRGALHEETLVMDPPDGSYSVITRRSIYLAYLDYGTGDLYLRGNIIPYRRSIG